jgi:hypothetical protein
LAAVFAMAMAVAVLLAAGGCEKGAEVQSELGKACESSSSCVGDLVCLTDFPQGYCSADCTTSEDCDLGLCVDDQCLASCGDDGDCREGYSCVHAAGGRVCAPPGMGYHGLGDACGAALDCREDLSCLVVSNEGSQCTETCTSVLNCGADADCVSGLCRRVCAGDADCQGGQVCASTADGRFCAPVPAQSPVGGPCAGDDDCESGLTCLTDAPDGYCTRGCGGAGDCDGGICHEGFCFATCSPTAAAADVLFVLDDSSGMAGLHDPLIAAVPGLLAAFDAAGTDYRLGVVTTDVSTGPHDVPNCENLGGVLQSMPQGACEGPPDPWITATNVADPAASFECIAAVGDQGCGFEQPLEALQRALSDAVNPGFIRPGAHLMVVILTTEDDCSAQNTDLFDMNATQFGDFTSFRCFGHGVVCDGVGPSYTNCRTRPAADGGVLYPISRYVSQLQGLKGDLSKVTVVAIAGPDMPVLTTVNAQSQEELVPSCMGATAEAQPGIRLTELSDAVFGHFFSICNVDYGQALQPLVDQVSGGGCRGGYQCTAAVEGPICEPQ